MRISIAVVVGAASLLLGSQVALSHDTGGPLATQTAWGNTTLADQIPGTAFHAGQAVYPRQRVTPLGWRFDGNQKNDCCDWCVNAWDTYCEEKRAVCGWHLRRHCGRCGHAGSSCSCTTTSACGTRGDDCGVVDDDCGCGQSCCCEGRCGFGVFRVFGLLHHGTCGCSRAATCCPQATTGCSCGAEVDAALQGDSTTDEIPPAPPVPDSLSE